MVTVQHNAPAPQSLEEKVNQLLNKARTPMGEDGARDVAELLERMLDSHSLISLHTRRRCFRALVKLCGEHGILPDSYLVPESKVEKLEEKPLVAGGFSDIWAGAYHEEASIDKDGTLVAIKVIRRSELDSVKNFKKNFCREVITWKRLSHPNILGLIGVTMNDKEFAMVSRWMEYGSIMDYVREYPEVNSLKLLEDAARGLEYLHGMELAHGDLKGANILISEDGCACLTDVGLMRIAGDPSSATAMTNTSTVDGGCTIRWSAPELLDPDRFDLTRGGPTKRSDIYSMGMTIYEVLTDKLPFYEEKEVTVMLLIGNGVRPKKPNFIITRGYNQELWEMTMSCWNEKPTERPKAGAVLGVLKIAAEQWETRNTGHATQPTQDTGRPTSYAGSDSHAISRPEGGNTTLNSLPHTSVTKNPVPPTTASDSISPSLDPPPPSKKNDTSSKSTLVTSDEKKAPAASKGVPPPAKTQSAIVRQPSENTRVSRPAVKY